MLENKCQCFRLETRRQRGSIGAPFSPITACPRFRYVCNSVIACERPLSYCCIVRVARSRRERLHEDVRDEQSRPFLGLASAVPQGRWRGVRRRK